MYYYTISFDSGDQKFVECEHYIIDDDDLMLFYNSDNLKEPEIKLICNKNKIQYIEVDVLSSTTNKE